MSYPSVAWRPEQVVGLARSMAVRMHTVNAAATTLTAPSPSAIVALRPLGPCWIATGHTTPVEQRRLYYWSARFSSWSASQYFANTTRALQTAFNDPHLGVCKLLCPDPSTGCIDTISTPCTSVSHDHVKILCRWQMQIGLIGAGSLSHQETCCQLPRGATTRRGYRLTGLNMLR